MPEGTAQFNCKEEEKKEGCAGIVVVSAENLVRFGSRGCGGCSPPPLSMQYLWQIA